MTTQTSTYEQQAQDFLKATGATFTASFLRHGSMNWDKNGETCDIYKCEISRSSRSYSFEFGQSLNNSGFYFTMGKKRVQIDRKYLTDEHKKSLFHHISTVSGRQFLNNGKSDVIHYPKAPTAYDVLASIQKHDVGTFEDFCSEFGYDSKPMSEYPQVKQIYEAVKNEFAQVCMLFSDSEIELLQEIN